MEIPLKIKSIFLCETQLTIIIIKRFFGYSYSSGSIVQIDFISVFVQCVMNLSPSFNTFHNFLNSSFFVPFLFRLTVCFGVIEAITVRIRQTNFPILKHNNRRKEKDLIQRFFNIYLLVHEKLWIIYFPLEWKVHSHSLFKRVNDVAYVNLGN